MKNLLNIFWKKAIDFDYFHYLLRILDNLPEGLIIIFLGFFGVFNLFKYNEKQIGNKIYPIVTSSMYPDITPGSLVYAVKKTSYDKNDIISYAEKTDEGILTGKLLTHRIIEKTAEGKYIVKGDANIYPDSGLIENSQIKGKVEIILPFWGYVDLLINTIPGFLVFILFPSLYLIMGQIKYLKSTLKAE